MREERFRAAIAGSGSLKASDAERLISRYIEQDPHRPGPDRARIVDQGVSVVALVAALDGDGVDVKQVARDYEVPAEAIAAALWYYQRHRDLIDARIALNEAFFAGRGQPVEHAADTRG